MAMQRALQLVHEVVEIRSSPTTVEILHKGARVASHLRSRERGKAWRWRRKMGPLWQGERGQGCGCAIADCRRKIARFEVVPTRERDENPRNPLCSRLSTRFPRAHRCCSMADFWRRGVPTLDHLRECLPSKAPEIVRVPGDAIERSERTRLHAASAGAGLGGAIKKVDTSDRQILLADVPAA